MNDEYLKTFSGAELRYAYLQLWNAIKEHHAQKADDRCIDDDAKLYAAAGLPPHDCRVGNKGAMLLNCVRFIENRCQSGGWLSYAELEAKVVELEKWKANYSNAMQQYQNAMNHMLAIVKNFSRLRVAADHFLHHEQDQSSYHQFKGVLDEINERENKVPEVPGEGTQKEADQHRAASVPLPEVRREWGDPEKNGRQDIDGTHV